jgi:hypothetical protein
VTAIALDVETLRPSTSHLCDLCSIIINNDYLPGTKANMPLNKQRSDASADFAGFVEWLSHREDESECEVCGVVSVSVLA